MKTKKFSKKLSLNKKTIADLDNGKMKGVYGGVLQSVNTDCASCFYTGCNCPETEPLGYTCGCTRPGGILGACSPN